MAAKLDLVAARNVSWAPTIGLFYQPGATPSSIRMQIRLYAGQPGDPVHDFGAVPFTSQPAPTAAQPDRRVLQLQPSVSKDDLKAFPSGLDKPEAGEADRFVHDIIATFASGAEQALAEGTFFLQPGVTTND